VSLLVSVISAVNRRFSSNLLECAPPIRWLGSYAVIGHRHSLCIFPSLYRFYVAAMLRAGKLDGNYSAFHGLWRKRGWTRFCAAFSMRCSFERQDRNASLKTWLRHFLPNIVAAADRAALHRLASSSWRTATLELSGH